MTTDRHSCAQPSSARMAECATITYTPDCMNAGHLRTEMILSSLLPPHSTSTSHTIRATDGSILYTYKSNERGKIMTGRVISLSKPSEKLTILDLDGVRVDAKRISSLKEFLILPETDSR